MPNFYNAPEIKVADYEARRTNDENYILMDVREPQELRFANLDKDPRLTLVPLSKLARHQLDALPDELKEKSTDIIVMCHHGVRSAQVTAWMLQQGWENVLSLEGGIDAYAREIDPAIGLY
jgi:rhodanese-related sulfurtransferase